MADHDYKNGGWKEKYRIFKWLDEECEMCGGEGIVDIGTCPLCLGAGDKLVPVDPKGVYFVTRLDEDPHARVGAVAYAKSIEHENPQLAIDIRRKLAETYKEEFGR